MKKIATKNIWGPWRGVLSDTKELNVTVFRFVNLLGK